MARIMMSPMFPMALVASSNTLEQMRSTELACWDSVQASTLLPSVQSLLRQHGLSFVNLTHSRKELSTLPFLFKLNAWLSTPFNQTLALDCDVYVVWPKLPFTLLQRTLELADIAMPMDPGRHWRLWRHAHAPQLCTALAAFGSGKRVRSLFLGAVTRLVSAAVKASSRSRFNPNRDMRVGDQEMLWVEWTAHAEHHQLRVLALPEEWYCPWLPLQRGGDGQLQEPRWSTSWKSGTYPCASLHGHSYTDAQLAQLVHLAARLNRLANSSAEPEGMPPSPDRLLMADQADAHAKRVPSGHSLDSTGSKAKARSAKWCGEWCDARTDESLPGRDAYLTAIDGADLPARSIHSLQVLYSPALLIGEAAGFVARVTNASCYFMTGVGDRRCGQFVPRWMSWTSNQGDLLYNPLWREPPDVGNHSDYTWVEVTRWPTGCMASLANSWSNRRGMPTACDGLLGTERYGCWFFVARGSGVFVNVGRSLRMAKPKHLRQLLNPTRDANGRRVDQAALNPKMDRNWCERALELGFDSIQLQTVGAPFVRHISDGDRGLVEIVICSGGCAQQSACGACPPLPLSAAADGSRPCACNESAGMINCGRVLARPCGRRNATRNVNREARRRIEMDSKKELVWAPEGWHANE